MEIALKNKSLLITDTHSTIRIQSRAQLSDTTRKQLQIYKEYLHWREDWPHDMVEVIPLDSSLDNTATVKFILRSDLIQLSMLIGGIWATYNISTRTANAQRVVEYLLKD